MTPGVIWLCPSAPVSLAAAVDEEASPPSGGAAELEGPAAAASGEAGAGGDEVGAATAVESCCGLGATRR